MPTANPTFVGDITGDGSVVSFSWPLTTANPDGMRAEWIAFSDQTWTAYGTWGGATLTIEGSADGTTWMPLSNAAGGTAATATANKIMTAIELPRYVRPNLTTPGSGASITVVLTARKATPMRT